MPLQSITQDAWFTGIGVQILLIAVLLVKKAWHKFPVFSFYIFFNLAGTVTTYCLFSKGLTYFYAFWIYEAIVILLSVAAVWEVFVRLFAPHIVLKKLALIIFRITVFGLIFLAGGVIYMQSGDSKGISSAVLLVAEAARIVEVGLIMFLFLSSS